MDARMKTIGSALVLGLVMAAQAAPVAMPFPGEAPSETASKTLGAPAIDALGDPGDFEAGLLAGADYLVAMAADDTEDNAGNGFVDDLDPDDAGWDWETDLLEHSAAPSAYNTYGVTAAGLVKAWQIDPKNEYFIAMKDAAEELVDVGPSLYRYSGDISFLLDFAEVCASELSAAEIAAYQTGAQAIWTYRLAHYGTGTAQSFAEYIRDARAGQGYANGIIAWDIALYVIGVQRLDDVFGGYAADAAAMADVLYDDAIDNPVHFDVYGACQGALEDGSDHRFWWYTLGVSGLIDAFQVTGTHAAAVPGLVSTLLACQYPDGSFSEQYGASALFNDRDYQSTAYATRTLGENLTGHEFETNAAAWWLNATQSIPYGWLDLAGERNGEVAGECTMALSYGANDYRVVMTPASRHIAENDGATYGGFDYVDRASVTFSLNGGSEAYRSVTVWVSYDETELNLVDFIELLQPEFDLYTYATSGLDSNPIEISFALLGPTAGYSGAVDLFSLEFDGVSDGIDDVASLVHIEQVVMRDPNNGTIFAAGGDDATIVVDDLEPTLVPTYAGSECVNDDFVVQLAAGDNVDLDRVMYSFDGGANWTNTGLVFDGTNTVTDFTVPAGGLGDGDYTVDFMVWDAVGYVFSPTGIEFHLDSAPPVGVASLVAMPANHAVTLTWTDDGGDSFDDVEIWRAKRVEDYPYTLGVPTASAWPVGFTMIDTEDGGIGTYLDDFVDDEPGTRGVYDYVLVTSDCVNGDAVSGMVSATNYFLGDWASFDGAAILYGEYDGSVCSYDLTILGGVYGLPQIDGGFLAEVDVAPTHDYSRLGLPGPDDVINFEDLIVLAMNYRACGVDPLHALPAPLHGKDAVVDAASSLELAGEGAVRQLLLDGELLGLTAEIATEARLVSATSSHGTAMFYATDAGWQVDVVGLADLLAADTMVELRFAGDADVALISAEGRDETNRVVELIPTGDVAAAQPASYGLSPNHPNPFNPTTTIRYSLAADGPARLSVYNALGQQVRVLVDGTSAAGEHEVRFDAGTLASGLYFYRLEAGDFVEQRKMLLVK